MPNPQQLPYQTNSSAIDGANQRATQNVFMSQLRTETLPLDAAYVEPLAINTGGVEPQSMRLARIVNLLQPDKPVQCGELVHFIFNAAAGGVAITSVDGLTSDPASRYRMIFEINYKAQN